MATTPQSRDGKLTTTGVNSLTWPCGHVRTPENTQGIGCAGVRCKTCRQRITQASYHRNKNADPDTRRLQYRVNYLPFQIHSAREKLARLEAEALRLGLRDLVEQRA